VRSRVVAVRYLTRLQESYNGTFCDFFVTESDEISTPATPPEGREGTGARERISIADVNSSPRH
jgi:hypothetical protein